MGQHKGWRSYPLGGAWVGAYRRDGKYVSQSFKKQGEATAWAMAEAAKVQAGLSPEARAVVQAMRGLTKELAADYVGELRARGRSESHLKDVRLVLDRLAQAVPDLAAPDAEVRVKGWLDGLKVSGRGQEWKAGVAGGPRWRPATAQASAATRNRYLVTVQGLCRWAVKWDRIEKDPTRRLEAASVPEFLKEQFTIEELRKLVKMKGEPYWRSFMVMLYLGLRAGEAKGLRWEDIDWGGKVVRVALRAGTRVKRNKERLVALQPELADALRSKSWSPVPVMKRIGNVVPGRDGHCRTGLAKLMTDAGLIVGGRTPHSCRHTYAGLMTATGLSAQLLSEYLGHSSSATTKIYTRLAARFVEAAKMWNRGVMRLTEIPKRSKCYM